MSTNRINIACGDSYIKSWLNFDYAPHSPAVKKANLLGKLPIEDCYADVVYSSHFLEHIPKRQTAQFLSECFRITKKGGILRLVLPDLEELCRAYLDKRDKAEHDKADYIVLEMLDQCVRDTVGGDLGAYYIQLQNSSEQHKDMIEFIKYRTGEEFHTSSPKHKKIWRKLLDHPSRYLGKLEKIYCGLVISLLPKAFRQQNVSMATVGERHAWIYDFYTVDKLLKDVGFSKVQRHSHTSSNILDFPFFPLDIYKDGMPRKGHASMYIEAIKA